LSGHYRNDNGENLLREWFVKIRERRLAFRLRSVPGADDGAAHGCRLADVIFCFAGGHSFFGGRSKECGQGKGADEQPREGIERTSHAPKHNTLPGERRTKPGARSRAPASQPAAGGSILAESGSTGGGARAVALHTGVYGSKSALSRRYACWSWWALHF
jgi:hypothetical protein